MTGAAGNFLASIDGMSENAFKTVMEIDTVCSLLIDPHHCLIGIVDRNIQHYQGHIAIYPRVPRLVHSR